MRLSALGRIAEALPALRASLHIYSGSESWRNASISASNLCDAEMRVGEVGVAAETAEQCVAYADLSANQFQMLSARATRAEALHALGRRQESHDLFIEAERMQQRSQPEYPLLYSFHGFSYCDLLLAKGYYSAVLDRATQTFDWSK